MCQNKLLGDFLSRGVEKGWGGFGGEGTNFSLWNAHRRLFSLSDSVCNK